MPTKATCAVPLDGEIPNEGIGRRQKGGVPNEAERGILVFLNQCSSSLVLMMPDLTQKGQKGHSQI